MSGWRFLPEGTQLLGADETLLWQGRPTATGMARRFLHVRAVTGYFLVLSAWTLFSAHTDGVRAREALVAAFWVGLPAVAAAALIYAVGWVLAVTTRYVLTDKRVIMQVGVALPIALTLPLRSIGSADMKLHPDGTGDITLAFADENRLAFLLLWPHARPGHYRKAQPMLRSVPDGRAVATLVARALVAASPEPARSVFDRPEVVATPEPALAMAAA